MEWLKCCVQQYAWGKQGEESVVAKLAKAGGHIQSIDPGATYAELWMGTHPNGPSLIAESGKSLMDRIRSDSGTFGAIADLKYLFKVLSINKPLSIQVHPDKSWAKTLFANQPEIYKDANHKPEMAIALTPFKALCGFRPLKDINALLNGIAAVNSNAQEYFGLITLKNADDLKCVFLKLMEMDAEKIKNLVTSLMSSESTPLKPLLQQVNSHFPNDRGVLCIYFLNYFELEVGEAIFLEPLTPHAYLSGDCIECMALSDNVIRAGLTPKLIDIKTLQEITNYKFSTDADFKVLPKESTEYNRVYLPPSVDDFSVQCLKVTRTHSESISRDHYTRIALVIEGEVELKHMDKAMDCGTGSVVLLHPQKDFTFSSLTDSSTVFIAY